MGNAPPHGGIGVYSRNLLWALREYCSATIAAEQAGGHGHTNLRPFWRLWYIANMRAQAGLGFLGTDIMHFTNAYVPPHRTRTKVVATVCDIDVIVQPDFFPPKYRWYGRRAIETAISRADMVLTISESSRNAIVEYFGIEPDKVSVAGIGVSPELIRPRSVDTRAENEKGPILLYVGQFFKRKNCAWLVRIITNGVRSGAIPPVQLILAGNPAYGFKEVQEEVRHSRGIARFVINPHVGDLARMYVRSNAVIMPSLSEGFGIPLIEAMHFDRPVVASRIPTHVEVAGGYAEFFELNDPESLYHAVRCALNDANAKKRQQFLRERFPEYLWSRLVNKYASVYERVLHDR